MTTAQPTKMSDITDGKLKIGNGYEIEVSGGGGGVWTDWVGEHVHLCTNIKTKTLKALASEALPKSSFGNCVPALKHDPEEKARHDRIVLEHKARRLAVETIDAGGRITVVMEHDYMLEGERAPRFEDVDQVIRRSDTFRDIGLPVRKSPPKGFRTSGSPYVRIKFGQVNWMATVRANGWDGTPAAVPTECTPA